MTLICACGSDNWRACAPGTEAEARIQGNVCILKPAPEVAMRVWCDRCWPWSACKPPASCRTPIRVHAIQGGGEA